VPCILNLSNYLLLGHRCCYVPSSVLYLHQVVHSYQLLSLCTIFQIPLFILSIPSLIFTFFYQLWDIHYPIKFQHCFLSYYLVQCSFQSSLAISKFVEFYIHHSYYMRNQNSWFTWSVLNFWESAATWFVKITCPFSWCFTSGLVIIIYHVFLLS
jgi:hypothetical protein